MAQTPSESSDLPQMLLHLNNLISKLRPEMALLLLTLNVTETVKVRLTRTRRVMHSGT